MRRSRNLSLMLQSEVKNRVIKTREYQRLSHMNLAYVNSAERIRTNGNPRRPKGFGRMRKGRPKGFGCNVRKDSDCRYLENHKTGLMMDGNPRPKIGQNRASFSLREPKNTGFRGLYVRWSSLDVELGCQESRQERCAYCAFVEVKS